jgi:hypothetical protein
MLFFVLLALATNVVPASLSLALNLVLLLIYDLLTAPRLVFRLARSVARRRRLILTLCYLFYFLVLLNVMVDHSLLGQFAPGREANAPRWVPRANAYYGINRQGFRGPEIELTDLRSFPRLLFLGDSSTFGLGVKADQAFPAVLERMLHQVGLLDARSLNAGVNGYDTFGLIYRYREFAAWKPNYVFIMDGIHFESPNTTSSRYFLPYVAPLRGLYWLTTLLQPRLALTSAAEKNDAYRRWMETLGKLVKEAKRGGGIVALISYPSDVIEGKVYYTVQAQARNAQVHYLGAYEAFGAQRKKLLWIDNVHPNQAGHHLLACLVAGWVAQQERSTVRLPECATLWGPPPTRP